MLNAALHNRQQQQQGLPFPSQLSQASSYQPRGLCESKGAKTKWQVEPEAAAVLSVAPSITWGSASGIPQSSCCWQKS